MERDFDYDFNNEKSKREKFLESIRVNTNENNSTGNKSTDNNSTNNRNKSNNYNYNNNSNNYNDDETTNSDPFREFNITKNEIYESVLNQARSQLNLKDEKPNTKDKYYETGNVLHNALNNGDNSNIHNNSNHKTNNNLKEQTNENNNTSWFDEYQKQPITISKEKIRAYLRNYEDLDKLIKYREKRLITGKEKPYSNTLELNKLENLNFLNSTNIDKKEFVIKVDYKLNEMRFYKEHLSKIISSLAKSYFIFYQFIFLKYFIKVDDENIKKTLFIKDVSKFDNILIDYIYTKLQEEANE